MAFRRPLCFLLATVLGLAQIACGPAPRLFDVLPASGPIDLRERVHVGDLVYLELHSGDAMRGKVEAVDRSELVVKGWIFPAEEMQSLVIEHTARDVNGFEKGLLTGAGIVVGTVMFLVALAASQQPI